MYLRFVTLGLMRALRLVLKSWAVLTQAAKLCWVGSLVLLHIEIAPAGSGTRFRLLTACITNVFVALASRGLVEEMRVGDLDSLSTEYLSPTSLGYGHCRLASSSRYVLCVPMHAVVSVALVVVLRVRPLMVVVELHLSFVHVLQASLHVLGVARQSW